MSIPEEVLTDQGTQFMSECMQNLMYNTYSFYRVRLDNMAATGGCLTCEEIHVQCSVSVACLYFYLHENDHPNNQKQYSFFLTLDHQGQTDNVIKSHTVILMLELLVTYDIPNTRLKT